MIRLRNALILIDIMAVVVIALAYDAWPNNWIINWTIFTLAVLGAIVAIQHIMRKETQ